MMLIAVWFAWFVITMALTSEPLMATIVASALATALKASDKEEPNT